MKPYGEQYRGTWGPMRFKQYRRASRLARHGEGPHGHLRSQRKRARRDARQTIQRAVLQPCPGALADCPNGYEDDCVCATCQFMREEDEYRAQLRFESEYRTIQSVSGKQESRESGWGDGETASAWG